MNNFFFNYSLFKSLASLNIAKSFLSYFFLRLLPLKVLELWLLFLLKLGLRIQKLLWLNSLKFWNCSLLSPFSLDYHSSINLFYVLPLSHTAFLVVPLLGIWLNHWIIYMILTHCIRLLRVSNKAVQRGVAMYWSTLIEVDHFVILAIVFLIKKVFIIFRKFFYYNGSFKEIHFGMNDFAFLFWLHS